MRTATDVLALIDRWYQQILTAYNLQLYARNACELEDFLGTLDSIREFILHDDEQSIVSGYRRFLETIPVTRNRSLLYASSRVADGADDNSVGLMQEMASIWRQYMSSPYYTAPP